MTLILNRSVANFQTKRGNSVSVLYRDETSDWNTLNSCIAHDEYGFTEKTWTGIALDIGAHAGGATIALLVDNPNLRVVSVEALPANVELLCENLDRNGLSDRCEVIQGAADCGLDPVTVAYGVTTTPFEAAHQFIGGNVYGAAGPKGDQIIAEPVSLTSLVEKYGAFDLAKIDCEGCEWQFLDDPAVSEVAEFRGEYHPVRGNGAKRLRELLEPTHIVELDDSSDFGPFRAVRR